MTYTDTAHDTQTEAGRKRPSVSTDPFSFMINLIRRGLKDRMDDEEIQDEFRTYANNNPFQFFVKFLEDYIAHNYPAARRLAQTPEEREAERAARRAERRERVEREVRAAKADAQQIKEGIIMNHVVASTGKLIRDSKGRDLVKEGGWLMELGKEAGLNRIVGRSVTEERAREIMRKHMNG